MHLSVGYSGQYRRTSWTPVRVTLQNRTSTPIDGTVEIPEQSNGSNYPGPVQPLYSVYQAPAVVPGGATKRITLFLPGYDVGNEVDVHFRVGSRTVAVASSYPTPFDDQSVIVGVLGSDPGPTQWLKRLNPPAIAVAYLSSGELDPQPFALAGFDVIVLADVDTSRLNHDQWSALNLYVRNGGALLLVGGPDWQETLRPVPASLMPGHLGGSTTVASMGNLPRLAGSALRSSAPATVTVLSGARGSVLAVGAGRRASSVPLIVKSRLGDGAITYLAFDPGFDPIRRWAAAPVMLWRTLRITAPAAVSRASRPSGFPPPPPSAPGFGGPFDIGAELANIPAAALPSFILFIALVALYIVLVGPINFLLLSRLRRRELAWVTIPSAALVCLCCTALVAFHLKGNAVLLNVAGVIQLDGSDEPHPATFYVGLFAPLKGDFHLTADMPALPASVPEFAGFGPTAGTSQSGMRLQEGAQTEVHFISMNMWSMRSVALYSSVRIGGHIGSRLHLDTAGDIVGTVFNGTRLRLIRPVITAGSAVVHLPDLPAGGSIAVRIRPSADVHVQAYQPVGYMLYGQSASSGAPPTYYWRGPVFPRLGYAPVSSFCCSSPPAENSLTDRVRNLASALPEAATIPFLGEVILAGWSEQALIPMTVEGTSPQRRDLNLVLTPLSVSFPSGSFILRPGVVGARLVDDQPSGPLTSCCAPGLQPIYIGAHGAATFEFDLPLSRKSRGKVTIRRLNLSVDAGGANGHDIGSVYDWRSGRWLPIDLASGQAALPGPDRFVSHDGSLLVRLRRTVTSGDLAIQNPYQNLQLSGAVMTR